VRVGLARSRGQLGRGQRRRLPLQRGDALLRARGLPLLLGEKPRAARGGQDDGVGARLVDALHAGLQRTGPRRRGGYDHLLV
jgi:hypothetical protein